MLFEEIIAVYFDNHMNETNTLYGQKTEVLVIKVGGK
jgi:hypothetical protein